MHTSDVDLSTYANSDDISTSAILIPILLLARFVMNEI